MSLFIIDNISGIHCVVQQVVKVFNTEIRQSNI